MFSQNRTLLDLAPICRNIRTLLATTISDPAEDCPELRERLLLWLISVGYIIYFATKRLYADLSISKSIPEEGPFCLSAEDDEEEEADSPSTGVRT